MNAKLSGIPAEAIPSKAQGIETIFDFLDVIFNLVDIFNAILEALRNFGNYLNGL
jgi:hypothetical protein